MNTLFGCPVDGEKRVIVLEAETNVPRKAHFCAQLERLEDARTWYLNNDLDQEGSWAGVNRFFESLMDELKEEAPELITKHDYELTMLMPRLRRSIKVRNQSLTDEAMGDERVRNYPVDRAFRILHGLVDLLKTWRANKNHQPWVILCDNHNHAGALSGPFFVELARRAGKLLNLTVVLVRDEGTIQETLDQLDLYEIPCLQATASLPAGELEVLAPAEARRLALELEEQTGNDFIEREVNYPRQISLWKAAGDEERALQATVMGLAYCNHNGFYFDGAHYVDYVLPRIEMYAKRREAKRWYILGLVYHPYAVTGRSEDALRIFEEEGLPHLTSPELKARMYYSLSMLHARFLEERDAEKAEAYLNDALELLEIAEVSEESCFFLRVFLKNGLALVRVRQRRPEEAAELCSWGFKYLDEHLDPQRHRLHRSVLLYNTAQVYARTNQPEKALDFYSDALKMDPNYSEYHNERGNVYQEMGRYQDALTEYKLAVELSAPYHEVHYNMGRCYLETGDLNNASRAFIASLDLYPNQPEAWLNLADIYEQAAQHEAALHAYGKAARWAENPADIYGNRAIVYYQLGRYQESLEDLNCAVEADPSCAELYQNRAVAREALNDSSGAAEDLQCYLRLSPQAEDRAEVEAKIESLAALA